MGQLMFKNGAEYPVYVHFEIVGIGKILKFTSVIFFVVFIPCALENTHCNAVYFSFLHKTTLDFFSYLFIHKWDAHRLQFLMLFSKLLFGHVVQDGVDNFIQPQ